MSAAVHSATRKDAMNANTYDVEGPQLGTVVAGFGGWESLMCGGGEQQWVELHLVERQRLGTSKSGHLSVLDRHSGVWEHSDGRTQGKTIGAVTTNRRLMVVRECSAEVRECGPAERSWSRGRGGTWLSSGQTSDTVSV